jgi:hypothetical protein
MINDFSPILLDEAVNGFDESVFFLHEYLPFY